MRLLSHLGFAALGLVNSLPASETAVELPAGVQAVWSADLAHRDTTPTRERLCLNGLWRWQPGASSSAQPPSKSWGYFKVPGAWPGITDYMQKDAQTVFAHPDWAETRLAGITTAWYERDVEVPQSWEGRRIALSLEYLNSMATVFLDGTRLGDIRFPGGTLDLTEACRPGTTHRLSLLVAALPLRGVLLSYTDSASAREVQGHVARRGLCGDAFLVATPTGPALDAMHVGTSVQRGECTFEATVSGLGDTQRCRLLARATRDGILQREFTSPPFGRQDLREGRFSFTASWRPDQLWDLHTPGKTFDVQLTLLAENGAPLDVGWVERVGFREFWIDGRDFYLNGTRLHLSALPLDNAQISAALATYAAARETLLRLREFGINYVYTHNYGCEPGAHLGFEEILRAADDVGMLVGFSQPHFSHYDWEAAGADTRNGYAEHAAFYTRAAGNHPSVVMYVMSHNATGYDEDMNPDRIDGLHDSRDVWALRNVRMARRAEAIVQGLDPGRIVYHHASGNLGVMHNSNFYPNFAPVQELDDWFEHWATQGVKPAFTCEYGAPFTWDWTMYRGWYKGEREWGSAKVPWEFCIAEWNAQFLGDTAYRISETEKRNLRWEARQFEADRTWHRWDYPSPVGSDRFDERYPILAQYIHANWRAFRTWGLSGLSPWEYGHYWKLRPGTDRSRRELPTDWRHLQRPGFSPDFVDQRMERMDVAYEREDWIATPAAQALIRNNRPLLAYIAGPPAAFTAKDHNFHPGERVEKQLILINDSRKPIACDLTWTLQLPEPDSGRDRVSIPAGDQVRRPLAFALPAALSPGRYEVRMEAAFDNGQTQEDRFLLDILPRPSPPKPAQDTPRVALFDPQGDTASLLKQRGVPFRHVQADTVLAPTEILVIGRMALTLPGPAPDLRPVRDGLRVVVFEQSAEVLEQRLGFRIATYGLRQLITRVPDHPILAGFTADHLRDWRGSATLLPPRLDYELRPRYGPTVQWAGMPAPRAWRCGNRGNVASVLIEKPARGDFLALVEGGFSLQYSPLLEYREGRGLILFCQLDVTGRTQSDPVADALAGNILRHVADWQPSPRRNVVYAGAEAGLQFLQALGISARPFEGAVKNDDLLVAAPGSSPPLTKHRSQLDSFLQQGGHVLALGLDQEEVATMSSGTVTAQPEEHIAAWFEPFPATSPFAGISPADVHNRDPRALALITSGALPIGDGVLARARNANIIFAQMAPWQFSASRPMNQKRTFRRAAVQVNRLLANLGAWSSTPLLERFHQPLYDARPEMRWRQGFYLDVPEEWDDPYRFFRW